MNNSSGNRGAADKEAQTLDQSANQTDFTGSRCFINHREKQSNTKNKQDPFNPHLATL